MQHSFEQLGNPYASPRLEPADSGTAAVGTVGNVLKASGSLSWNEGRRIHRVTGVGVIRQVIVFLVLAVAMLTLYGLARRDPLSIFSVEAIPVLAAIVVFMGGFLLLSHLGPHWHMRRQFVQRMGIFQPQEFEFRQDSILIRSGLIETRVKWQAFSHFKRSRDLALIYLAGPSSFFAVPRRFFDTTEEWESFVALAEQAVGGKCTEPVARPLRDRKLRPQKDPPSDTCPPS